MSGVSAHAKTQSAPDGGWGWFVVIATFTSCFLCSGSYYSFGILFVAFLEKYGGSKAATALTGAMSTLGFVLMSSYGLVLARKIGHRKTVMLGGVLASTGVFATAFVSQLWQTYVTFGLLIGTGLGFSFVVCIEMVGKYFKKRFSIAIGLALAGTGAGQFVLSILSQTFLDKYGLRGTLIITSAVFSHLCVAGALLKPLEAKPYVGHSAAAKSSREEYEKVATNEQHCTASQYDNHNIEHSETGKTGHQEERKSKSMLVLLLTTLYDFSLCKEPVFLLMLIIAVGQIFGQAAVGIHLVRRALDFGIGSTQSAYIPAIMGIAQLVGRPIFGAIGNFQKLNPSVPFGVAIAMCALSLTVSFYTTSFTAQVVFVVIFGACLGGYTVLNSVVVAHFMGQAKLGYGTSFIIHVHGIVGLLVGPLLGWMRDNEGTYEGAFWLAGGAMMCSAAIAFLLPVVDRLVRRKGRKRCPPPDK